VPSVDELLNAAEVVEATLTETNDKIEIDADTRTMIIPDTERIFGVMSDEKGERKYFRCKRFVGNGIDLSKLDVRVIYQNASGLESGRDKYIVTDLATDGEDYVTFSWELSRKVTAYNGVISFIVCAIKTGTDGIITNEWNTTLANGVVLDGLEVSGTQEQEKEAYDYYKQLEAELLKVANEQKTEIKNVIKNKVDKPTVNDNNKIPRAKDGEVEWVEVGQPTDEQTNNAVKSWLNEHPEATTTVQDGSIEEIKINKNFLLYIKNNYVTPEMFGAIGDGKTDDTNAFILMLNSDNIIWKLDGNKTYKVNTFTITKKIIVDGNGAVIKSQQPIIIDATIEESFYYSSYNNIIFDGGLNIVKGSQMYITNCVFRNATNGISYSNSSKETFITKCRINNCDVGIYSNGSDVEVSYITIRECYTALLIKKPSTFSNVHAWLSDNFVGSKFADCYADATFNDCYSDTYQYAFYVNTVIYLKIYNVFCLRNVNYWDDTEAQYLLYSNNKDNFIHTLVEGGSFIGDKLHEYYFSNYQQNIFCCKGLDVARYIKNADTNYIVGLTLESGSIVRNNNNNIIINPHSVTISATIEFDGNGTGTQKVASVSESIAPSSTIIAPCGITTGDGATYSAFRNLSNLIIDKNGDITIRNKEALSGKMYVGIFITYVAKNRNYIN
jgi:hypothetical protein